MGHSRSTVLWCMMRETPVSRKEWQIGKRIKVVRDIEQQRKSTTIVTTMYNKKQRVVEGADGSFVRDIQKRFVQLDKSLRYVHRYR